MTKEQRAAKLDEDIRQFCLWQILYNLDFRHLELRALHAFSDPHAATARQLPNELVAAWLDKPVNEVTARDKRQCGKYLNFGKMYGFNGTLSDYLKKEFA